MDFSSFFDYPTSDSDNAADELAFLPNWRPHDWDKLIQHMQTQVFGQGDTVIRVGETERALHIVAFGTLEVLFGDTLTPIATISEGSVLGEQTFLDGKPRSATIRAAMDSQTLYLSF